MLGEFAVEAQHDHLAGAGVTPDADLGVEPVGAAPVALDHDEKGPTMT